MLGAPASWSYKLIPFQENKLCTSTTVFKYCKGIAPFYLNDMFMPSLNNYNTRSQMALDVEQIKDKKVCHFLDQRSGIR